MRILIVTVGSRGDVQPYLALGCGLQGAGHAVSLCTSERFADIVASHGLDYRPMNNGFIDLMSSIEGRTALEGMGSAWGAIKALATLVPKVGPLQMELQQDAWVAAQAVRPELILYHPKIAGAVDIANELGVPAILAPVFPQYVRTAAFPAVGLPDWPLGDSYRRGTYRLVHGIGNHVGAGPIRRWRSAAGLAPRPPKLGPFNDAQGHAVPVLHGYSELLCARPDDWPDTAVVTGHWELVEPPLWAPPATLGKFLAAGPPPVYVGFGSMAGRRPQRVAAIVIEALKLAGCRGLLASGWGGLSAGALPAEIMAIDELPHHALFPQVAAVVHHGGAGTTHAGLRAGRPTIICPFFGDQPFWGRRVHALGAGPRPIPQRRLTAERLAAAITEATSTPSIASAAADLGARLRAERGVETAVAWIERWVAAARR